MASPDNAVVLDSSGTTLLGLPWSEYAGEDLLDFLWSQPQRPDIALVHAPISATPVDGTVPLMLAGYRRCRGGPG